MLGTVAGAAAGVVAGGFLYQGINNLMHRNDSSAGGSADHSASHHAQGLLGDSTGFESIVPDDDSDMLAAGDDNDSDVV